MRIKVGVIGTGAMGQHHVRIYSEFPDVELVGIADIDSVRVNEQAARYKTKAFTDYRELLKQDLDAVSIVVPTMMHKEVALAAIEAGVNVLIEKPIADTLESAAEIIESASSSGLKLMIGHIERFNPAVMKLKEIIDSGALGKVVSISTRRVGPYNPRIRDVGVIMDIGVHDVDVISYLYGMKVSEVYAVAGADIHSFEDHAAIILRFGHEYSGIVETNWLTPHKIRKLTAIGLKGVAYLDYIDQTVELHDEGWIRKAKVEKSEPLRNELQYFIRCISKNEQPFPSGEDGKYALEVATASIESYRYDRAVKVRK
ncbi:MAG: UDP-N-acetylglucosamine 3-dehydrogenase [Candidatus Methanoperedens sp.]|nr:UDP-N-acetylglucosamine 3-dehydrogenase [Candidatus Methanoperedens sp.]